MPLPNKDYTDLTGANVMSSALCLEVQNCCNGLSSDEVKALLLLDGEKFSEADNMYFEAALKRGQALAKQQVVQSLMSSMKDRGGYAASINYLMRFGDKWDSDVGDTTTGKEFIFNMITKQDK